MNNARALYRQFRTTPGQAVLVAILGAIAGLGFALWGYSAGNWVQLAAGLAAAAGLAFVSIVGTRALWRTRESSSHEDHQGA